MKTTPNGNKDGGGRFNHEGCDHADGICLLYGVEDDRQRNHIGCDHDNGECRYDLNAPSTREPKPRKGNASTPAPNADPNRASNRRRPPKNSTGSSTEAAAASNNKYVLDADGRPTGRMISNVDGMVEAEASPLEDLVAPGTIQAPGKKFVSPRMSDKRTAARIDAEREAAKPKPKKAAKPKPKKKGGK